MSTNGAHCHDYVRASDTGVGVRLLDDLEKCSVELGEDLVAVFQLKANVVGFHPGDVLNTQQPTHTLEGLEGKFINKQVKPLVHL